MNILRDGACVRQLSTLFNEGCDRRPVTDSQLLERFATRRGKASRRLRRGSASSLAGRSCCAVPVGSAGRARGADAFPGDVPRPGTQKQKSLWVRDSLGPWIHSAAYRVASCARAAIRRRRHAALRRAGRRGWPSTRMRIRRTWRRWSMKSIDCRAFPRPPLVLCDPWRRLLSRARAATPGRGRHSQEPAGSGTTLRDRLIRRGVAPSLVMPLGAALMPEMAARQP